MAQGGWFAEAAYSAKREVVDDRIGDRFEPVVVARHVLPRPELGRIPERLLDIEQELTSRDRAEIVVHDPEYVRCGGFYEWTRRGEEKQPWLFGLKDGGPFAFARLWEHWTVPEGAAYTGSLAEWAPGEVIETCTILTTAANAARGAVHGRAAA